MAYSYGRIPEFDELSRNYGVAIRDGAKPKSVEWKRYSPILDQGQLGSCTGNAMAAWLGCAPHCTSEQDAAKYDEDFAVELYSLATRLDKFPGAHPPDDTGSSGLAVAKAAKWIGEISSYSWAFTTRGLLHALQSGPVLVGTVFLEEMERPDSDGVVIVAGAVMGGHEYLVRGYDADHNHLICDNSWSTRWGVSGSFRLPLDGWEVLRKMHADVTVPKI